MTVQMNIAEAKAKLSELVARAEAGEEVIIARDGKPVVVLRPANDAAPKGPRQIGFLAHLGRATINDPDWDKPDPADAEFAEQTFEEDHAARVGREKP